MVSNKIILIIGISICILIILAIFIYLRAEENYWIQDSKGVWIKHGSPLKTPEEVLTQQRIIICAKDLYSKFPKENISSQCLGSCDNYAVDLVNNPKIEEDSFEKNLCESIVRGQLTRVIEMDKEGNIITIIG
jgi:hypothetical protein